MRNARVLKDASAWYNARKGITDKTPEGIILFKGPGGALQQNFSFTVLN